MKIDFQFMGGPLDGAGGTMMIDGDVPDRRIGLPFNDHNYVLDVDTRRAHHTRVIGPNVEKVKWDG